MRDYERNQEILSGLDANSSDKTYPFDYVWEKTQKSDQAVTSSRPIPGHSRGKPSKSPRSPRNSIPKSPSSSSLSRSPKSPKSPSSLAGLTNEELQKLKEDAVRNSNEDGSEVTKKPSVVKFEDDFPALQE